MISPEIRAQMRRYFYAEHWKIGTIARELNVHPDAVRNAIEAQRLGGRTQPLRASAVDPLRRVHPSDLGSTSTTTRHPHLPDGP
jgi:hypothetical protein